MLRPHFYAVILLSLLAVRPCSVLAQGTGNNGGGGNNNGGNNSGGILIDPEGVLRPMQVVPALNAKRRPGAKDLAPGNVCVSLRRLNEILRQAPPDALPAEAHILGGLTRIDQVVVDAEARDILLIGPGETQAAGAAPTFLGETSGRALMRTGDFLTMLDVARGGGLRVRCSIDPDPARLKKYNETIQSTAGSVSFKNAAAWYEGLSRILGRQIVTVEGVPGDSRIGNVLAAADYSMKRIALGLEPSGVKEIRPQLAYAAGDTGATMKRWWFAPLYEDVAVSPDRTLFQFSGQRVKLLAQEELILDSGQRVDSDRNRPSTEAFARQFTTHFEELTAARPIFADLRNQFDLAVTVSLLVRERLLERMDLEFRPSPAVMDTLSPKCQTPRFVDSGANIRRVNRTTIVGVVGGVVLTPSAVIANEVPIREPGRVADRRAPDDLAGSQFAWPLQVP
ncbi:hypothetical protein Pan44_32560 [Caulifigura coniformis]|uniref:DUF1598 domain-containing protein n=1 Tax=Caulifigura coniformis TaxID=2527983 RepID=A0A517SGF5_9PLAN|nr:DUF1598 domain-containing protein [Caulifigura coniformis]QDT55214.1 hypothetical protein Pan44_32560 [Caulifigura coniformis]